MLEYDGEIGYNIILCEIILEFSERFQRIRFYGLGEIEVKKGTGDLRGNG